ncbi:hypothetical protein [Atlantibacter hermannii]|uniref:hypothetical protein n=1 Tax=Atlantibacter hermannii TaxID=565 RepID=UPI0028AC9AF8|nr:hypothetical protein [Atlantibacter hermannii]
MQISNLPKLLPVPFASSGSKQDIPVASQIGVEGGRASYTDGFPPLTRTPIAAGGIPPFGTDFNGVLNDVTAAIRWAQSGGGYRYDSTFSAAIGGYPIGAVINNSTGDGCWLNTIDGNNNNPEVATATPLTGWVPVNCYGSTNLSGLGASSLTLNTLQASKDIITLSGTLTANISIILPAWIKKWNIANNCTGSFSVTVKTPSGTGVVIPTGSSAFVHGDGTNIVPTLDPTLAAIANLSASANKLPYFSGVDIAALTDLTSVGRDIIGKNTIADVLTYLGLGDIALAGTITGVFDTNGYMKIPAIIGGERKVLIFQWMSISASATASFYNIPVAWPTKGLHAWAIGQTGTDQTTTASVFVETNLGNQQVFVKCINAAGALQARGVSLFMIGL